MDRRVRPALVFLSVGAAAGLLLLCVALAGFAYWQAVNRPTPQPVPTATVLQATPALEPPPAVAPTPVPQPIPPSLAQLTEARLNEALVPVHDPVALHAVLAPHSVPSSPTSSPRAYQVGDRRLFRLHNRSVEAELIHITDHAYIWLVVGQQADRQALIAAGNRFESQIYPALHRVFGSEWSAGIDGDVHLSIVHYRDPQDDAAGSFDAGDELPGWIESASNETEMFKINLDGMDPGDDYYFAVLAHEFEHMIHWNTDRNEEDWLDEGLAELACRVAGFDPGSSDESFLLQPDTQLTVWPYEDDATLHYGAGYLFALFLWERFGDDLIWDLVHRPANGLAALDEALAERGTGLSADQVFSDWVLANLLDEGEYAYAHKDWKVHRGRDAVHDQYPVSRQATVYPYATDYVELTGQGQVTVRFQGEPLAALLPTTPHTGKTLWWSNVGNRSDARLIGRFDLSGLSRATLRFWTWYDLEQGYDYVYVSASADGQTWQVLEGQYAARGGEYGPGYNGRSGGWVQDEIDLSPYAGGPLWLRFDYVTDDSINGAGFFLDDLEVPELGWMDPCQEPGGWQAEGFVLVGPVVPVRWVVVVIEFPAGDGPAEVHRLALDQTQAGEAEVALGQGIERAVLAISALARGTTEPVEYTYEIAPR